LGNGGDNFLKNFAKSTNFEVSSLGLGFHVSVSKVTVSTTSPLFTVANAKTKTQLKLICYIFHFAYKIQQNFAI